MIISSYMAKGILYMYEGLKSVDFKIGRLSGRRPIVSYKALYLDLEIRDRK